MTMTRQISAAMATLIAFMTAPLLAQPAKAERPNILWITSEDNSPLLGCYGDKLAHTPNLDALAAEGFRYRNAFANAPVCSSSRTTLITGMYACSLGAGNHRSEVQIPAGFKLYPEHLRAAGYYCTNNSKTDYNLTAASVGKPWDESSGKAHYRNRTPGRPFFAVFNITTSHEGQLTEASVAKRRKQGLLPPKPRVPPQKVVLPPYHADTPTVRRDWSIYYDNMTLMDQQAGELLRELEEFGLANDTIVIYCSDHGGALPRGKRNIHDSGTRVPLIVRIPRKWAHLGPRGVEVGGWVDQPVSFVDVTVTLLSLAGAKIAEHYQGVPFLGEQAGKPRDHVFLFRGRMDERYDTVRAIRDRQYRYVRNYSPHRPWGQHYSYPFQVMPSMGSWFEAFEAGECNEVQARYWQPKPSEELYDTAADPYEVANLVGKPEHARRLAIMRKALRDDMIDIRDIGLIPEGMIDHLRGQGTIYDYAQSDAYPIERVIDIADKATSRDPAALPDLIKAMNDEHPVIRYWSAMGCLVLQDRASPAQEKLRELLRDEALDVRVAAAEAMGYLGDADGAVKALDDVIHRGNRYEVLAALNALEYMWRAGHVSLPRVQQVVKDLKLKEPADRIPAYLLSLRDGK